MKKAGAVVFGVVLGIVLMGNFAFAQQDAKGCKDHPLFSKMPNYYIYDCKKSDFDAYEFYDPDSQGKKKVTVEGRKHYIQYYIKNDFSDKPSSPVQIIRNHENAVKKIGGKTYTYYVDPGGERSVYTAYKRPLRDLGPCSC